MRLPASIIINGCEIYIQYQHNLVRDLKEYGQYSAIDMKITIDADISDQKKEVIFFHELMEAIKDIYLIEDEKFDHSCIQPIAMALYELVVTKQLTEEG